MSSFLGTPSDRWPLARAVDALAQAARVAGLPGLIWIAGFSYPSLNLNVDLFRALLALAEDYTGIDLPGDGQSGQIVALFAPKAFVQTLGETGPMNGALWLLLGIPIVLVFARLIVGLARVCDPRLTEPSEAAQTSALESGMLTAADLVRGRPARLRTAWRAGKGLGIVAMGLWLMLIGLLFGAALFLIAPAFLLVRSFELEDVSGLFAGLLILPMALLLAYAVVLMVLNQLALHSLAHNRRGVSSALIHAWRMVRASPMSALRATAVDLVLAVSVLAIDHLLSRTLGAIDPVAGALPVVLFLLYGFAGVTRAGFWARAYRALGGMSSGDQIPGL